MRVKQLVAASAASGILALGFVPGASAASSSVVVQPGSVMPGGQVSVFGTQCDASTGTATSAAFSAPISLSMLSNATGGVGMVSASAKPGTWAVTVKCGAQTFTGWVTVASKTTMPSGGAATGDGSSQASAAAVPGVGSGVAMVAAGAGLGAFVLRRRRRAAAKD